jgi:hypothetical protein
MEVADKPSLKYMYSSFKDLGMKPHPIWSSVDYNPAETKKVVVTAKVLTGSYTLKCHKAVFSQFIIELLTLFAHFAEAKIIVIIL